MRKSVIRHLKKSMSLSDLAKALRTSSLLKARSLGKGARETSCR